jgi:LAO/AO transport system kinase
MISTSSVGTIQRFRKIQPSAKELVEGILAGNITALSAITLIESTNTSHLTKANEVVNSCLPHAKQSVRIGTF